MQAIYDFVVSMEISTILCGMFVAIYGLPFAIRNWWIWFISLFNGRGFRQREVGKLLDILWLLCVLWLVVLVFK